MARAQENLYRQFSLVCPDPVALAQLPLREDDLLQEHLGGHAVGAGAEDDDLLDGVGGRDGDLVLFGDEGVGGLLDIEVGRLRLPGEDDVDVVPAQDLAGAAGHLVGVEDQDDLLRPVSGKVGQDVHQLVAGGLDVPQGQLPQVVPGKNDVVAVDQQVVVLRRLVLFQAGAAGTACRACPVGIFQPPGV